MTTLKTWYISTYASRREWIKLKVCFFGGSIGKTCVLILSFKAILENCISLESWKTQLSNDILNEGINLFCGPLRSKIEMTNVIANHFSRCGSRLVPVDCPCALCNLAQPHKVPVGYQRRDHLLYRKLWSVIMGVLHSLFFRLSPRYSGDRWVSSTNTTVCSRL